jgi:hypothetical protein
MERNNLDKDFEILICVQQNLGKISFVQHTTGTTKQIGLFHLLAMSSSAFTEPSGTLLSVLPDESLETIFLGLNKFFNADLGSGMEKIWLLGPG